MKVTPTGAPHRPSGAFYAIGILIILAGAGVFAITLVGGLGKITNQMSRLVAPGQLTFACSPGSYTVYHEYDSVVGDKIYHSDSIAGLSVSMKDGAGEPVALAVPFGSSRYSVGGRAGRSAFTGRVTKGGTCTLAAGYASGSGPETVLAVGPGMAGALAKIVAVGGISLGAGIVIGALVIVMTARRRRRLPPPAGAGRS